MTTPESQNEKQSPVTTAKNLIDLAKVAVSFFTTAIWPIVSWKDPTFFGLLVINPDFGKPLLKWVVVVGLCIIGLSLVFNWGFWKLPRTSRGIRKRGFLITVVLLLVGMPILISLFNLLTSYLSDHPESDSMWRDYFHQACYVLVVTAPVCLISRIAVFLYPSPKKSKEQPAKARVKAEEQKSAG
jgi:ABC-type transport system involved in cytochrome c biogenesis permease component